MNRLLRDTAMLLAALAAAPPWAPAQRPAGATPRPEEAKPAAEAAKPVTFRESTSRTQHSIRMAGKELKYTATAGTVVLAREDGTQRAAVFYTAYTLDNPGDLSRRPITFAFNGGPGSSSVWLHLGALGPRRVLMNDDGTATPPPYKLVDNEYTILEATDLVFIDPVSTGYSRAVTEQEARQFHGVRGDVESVAEIIRLYTTRNQRWPSPKYLAGESYGTTRAAALAGYLQSRLGMNLNGIMLISSILNFQTARFDVGNDMPYVMFLPTYTATAWYHKRLPRELQADLRKTLDEAERFATGEYLQTLMKGDNVPAQERAQIAKRLARYTGLSPEFVDKANLRVNMGRFAKELLRSEKRTVGRYDSRLKGIDRDSAGERFEYDPSYAAVQGAFTGTWNDYVRAELKFETDLPYEILTGRVQPWSYAGYENQYVNVAETLRGAMTENPHLRVFVAKGYYDLATPYFAADYTMGHLELDSSLRKNISSGYYEAGHMMYIHKPSLEQLKRDLLQFIR